MNSFKVIAIVAKRRNFLEKDRILTLFSKEEGKIEAIAKGARRPGNRLSPNSDIGTIAKFHIHRARSLDIISEIEPTYHPFGARGEFDKTQKISYALKLVDKIFELGEAHPRTYVALQALIESVAEDNRQLIFLKFLLEIMSELGGLPDLVNCPHCQKKVTSSDSYLFSIGGGLTHQSCADSNCSNISDKEVKLLRLVATLPIEEVINYKTDKEVYEKTYRVVMEYFNWEFGKILPDEVM